LVLMAGFGSGGGAAAPFSRKARGGPAAAFI